MRDDVHSRKRPNAQRKSGCRAPFAFYRKALKSETLNPQGSTSSKTFWQKDYFGSWQIPREHFFRLQVWPSAGPPTEIVRMAKDKRIFKMANFYARGELHISKFVEQRERERGLLPYRRLAGPNSGEFHGGISQLLTEKSTGRMYAPSSARLPHKSTNLISHYVARRVCR